MDLTTGECQAGDRFGSLLIELQGGDGPQGEATDMGRAAILRLDEIGKRRRRMLKGKRRGPISAEEARSQHVIAGCKEGKLWQPHPIP